MSRWPWIYSDCDQGMTCRSGRFANDSYCVVIEYGPGRKEYLTFRNSYVIRRLRLCPYCWSSETAKGNMHREFKMSEFFCWREFFTLRTTFHKQRLMETISSMFKRRAGATSYFATVASRLSDQRHFKYCQICVISKISGHHAVSAKGFSRTTSGPCRRWGRWVTSTPSAA